MKALRVADVDRLIYTIRAHRVMLDSDLARIYGVSTTRLNEQVSRNLERFPEDFMFQLTKKELADWMSQFAISNPSSKMSLRKRPRVFTEHGAVMLSAVLKTPVAVAASINVVRAFNRLRQLAGSHKDLADALSKLEKKISSHDEHIQTLFAAIHEIMEPPVPPRRKIGFNQK